MKHLHLLIIVLLFIQPIIAQVPYKKVLFDYTQNETAGNSDWIIDTDQPVPSPAQSGITQGTAESYWLGAISAWGVDLVKKGYTVHTLTNTYGITYGNSSNAYDLSKYNLFIVCEPQNPFTAAEKSAILAFVQNGGGLVMVADHNGSDRDSDGWDSPEVWNDFGSQTYFGIHFQSVSESYNSITDTSTNISASLTDSIIRGAAGTVTAFSYHAGTTMTITTANNSTVKGHVWQDGASQSTSRIMAATATYGLGRVGGVGDSSPADDGSAQPGNSSIYDGWTESGSTNNFLLMNMSIWCASAPRMSAPSQVSLLNPANAATNTSLPLICNWQRTDSTTKYHIQVSTSNTFTTFAVNDSILTDTTKALNSLSTGTTYYWHVRAGNAAGWGTYSTTRSFTTWSTPAQVTTVAPADLATEVAVPAGFVWNAQSGATTYQLQVSLSSGFGTTLVNDSLQTDTIETISGLTTNTMYYWRVRAKNAAGWGSYSTITSFTTWSVPNQILLLAPDHGSFTNSSLTLQWQNDPAATGYELLLSTTPTFDSTVLLETGITADSFALSSLDTGVTYYWKVRGTNGAGGGLYSSVRSFTVAVFVTIQSELSKGWNMVSIPVTIDDMRTLALFPYASSSAFVFENGYSAKDTLQNGKGYWIKYASAGNESLRGREISSDTIDVQEGWNLVGMISTPVQVTCVQAAGTTILSDFFGYNAGYLSVSTLEPMKAYWVKVSSSGQIVLKNDCVR